MRNSLNEIANDGHVFVAADLAHGRIYIVEIVLVVVVVAVLNTSLMSTLERRSDYRWQGVVAGWEVWMMNRLKVVSIRSDDTLNDH